MTKGTLWLTKSQANLRKLSTPKSGHWKDLACEFANYLALNLARYLAYFAAPMAFDVPRYLAYLG
jgi:hypothetical protein